MTTSSDNQNKSASYENATVFSVVTIVLSVCCGVAAFFYSHWGKSEIEQKLDLWGQFGDFFGGVLNPVIGLGGVVLLAYTLIQNQKALSETAEIMKSQANIIQHDQRRQSLISISSAFTSTLKRKTSLNFNHNGADIESAMLSEIFYAYYDHVLNKDLAACAEFYTHFEKWGEITMVTSLFALKQIVDEETDFYKKHLLLAIVTSFIPVYTLLLIYSFVRAHEKDSDEVIKVYAFTLDFIRDCTATLGVTHLLQDFEAEAERIFKHNKK